MSNKEEIKTKTYDFILEMVGKTNQQIDWLNGWEIHKSFLKTEYPKNLDFVDEWVLLCNPEIEDLMIRNTEELSNEYK